jgi:hypothetical protein
MLGPKSPGVLDPRVREDDIYGWNVECRLK